LLLLFLISLFAIRSGVSALHPPPVAPAFSPATLSYPYSTFPTFLLLYLHFLQAPTYHPLLIGQTLPPTMAPGWKPGPSKWDGGSLLTFLGSPTANGKPPLPNIPRIHPPFLWTWSPPASQEATVAPTPAALCSYAAAAASNLPTTASPMDVDKPVDSISKHSATPP